MQHAEKPTATVSFDKRVVVHVASEKTIGETVREGRDDPFSNSWFRWMGAALKVQPRRGSLRVPGKGDGKLRAGLAATHHFSQEQQTLTWIDIGDVGSAPDTAGRLGGDVATAVGWKSEAPRRWRAVADTFAQNRPGSGAVSSGGAEIARGSHAKASGFCFRRGRRVRPG